MPSGALAISLAIATSCAPPAHPWIGEILYDAAGDDSGFEFIELFNPSDAAVSLSGVRVEAGDGSGPGRWSLRWTGGAQDSIAARGRFVVGGARVLPTPNAIVTLELQNGPDAVRLVFPDGAAEIVGYGALEHGEYFCGAPATDGPSGQSLARLPDGSNQGSNALDFRPSSPSPGAPNQVGRDVGIVSGSLALSPPQPEPGSAARLALSLTNLGRDPIAAGACSVTARAQGEFGELALVEAHEDREISPGDTLVLDLGTAPLIAGRQRMECRVRLAGDERTANDADTLWVRVGLGPLEITEIQFHPAGGEGEWVELLNRSADALALESFTLGDRGGTRAAIRSGRAPLPPESLAVIAQDRAALLTRFPALDSARVWQASPWPSLNNSNDATGTADAVIVRETDGVPCARVDYSASGIPAGVPLERSATGIWEPARDPAGSPLHPPRALAAIAGAFEVFPRRLRASARGSRIAWSLPWARARVGAEIYAFSGRRIGAVLPETALPGRGEREWNAAGIAPGVYVVVFRARSESGGESLSASRVIRIEEGSR